MEQKKNRPKKLRRAIKTPKKVKELIKKTLQEGFGEKVTVMPTKE